jgi:hypothetical protein
VRTVEILEVINFDIYPKPLAMPKILSILFVREGDLGKKTSFARLPIKIEETKAYNSLKRLLPTYCRYGEYGFFDRNRHWTFGVLFVYA